VFYDQTTVNLKAGDGGNGLVSFFRTRGVPKGGPDGGDGGDGGSIYFEADTNLNTLSDFVRKKEYKAKSGEPGGGQKMHGKSGEDMVLKVPVGTLGVKILDEGGEQFLFDLKKHGERIEITKGGKGGFGNAHFTSSTRQAPRFAELGSPGQDIDARLELRLLADVGLVGFPNCGKSTLLSKVSDARPKIANYPFTTIIPNLGVVKKGKDHLVVADIPGLIEGASVDKGLGYEFLRHIKRTRLIIHMIDGLSDDWVRDYLDIRKELVDFDESLKKKKELIIINKIDVLDPEELKDKLKEFKKTVKKRKVYEVSAVTGKGIKELFNDVFKTVSVTPIPEIDLEKEKIFTYEDVDEDSFEIKKVASGFRIYSKKLERIAKRTDFSNWEALDRLIDVMKKIGITKQLKKEGIKEDDKVWIGDRVLEW